MCGIAGIFGHPDQTAIAAMTAALSARGPDDSGFWADNKVSLGHTRLSIIDLSVAGHQPMVSADGDVVITFNGEIYNYLDLRRNLEKSGAAFRSHSDTEVILALYLKYRDDFVRHLRGIFAIAIYDRRLGPGQERMLLARDQFGVKPLLYADILGNFVFASELKALLASGLVSRQIDPIAVRELLMMGAVCQPRTMLSEVSALPPAHLMIVDRSGKRLQRYWTLERNRISGLRDASYAEAVTAVREALEDSVAHQMIADVPVGAFLSGGIDSGLLVALMARQSAGHLKTFSVGFDAEGSDIDESDDADLVARYLGTDHQRLEITGKDMLASIGEIGRALDQPSVDGVNSFFVSKAASKDVKVSISGTGGDELFAGYPWFSAMQNASIPPGFGPIAEISRKFPVSRGRIRNIIDNLGNRDFLGKFSCQHRIFSTQQTERLLDSNLRHFASGLHHAELLRNGDELSYGDRLERVSALCLRGYTQNQLLRDIDAVSMHHSLEVRVPFLDTLVADTAFSVAENVKIYPFQDEKAIPGGYRASGVKRVLLDVGRSLLPEGFDNRPKRGFGMPFDRWLGAELNEVMRDCLSQSAIKNRGLFDPAATTNLVDSYEKGEVPWAHVWVLLITELWCQQVLDITAS